MRNEKKKKKADLIVSNGTVLTMAPGSVPIQNGAVAILGGRIAALGTTSEIKKSFVAPKTIDAGAG